MKNQLILYCFLFCAFAYSQEKHKTISGKVFFKDDIIADVHIINKNSNIGTTTNDIGLFEIPVKIGDTLAFSHINIKDLEIAITKEIINKEIFSIHVKDKTYQLDEITLGNTKSIFSVDPEIMPPPTVNAKTLQLPYANTKAKKDYSIVKFSSGAAISLDNLINTLNGNNRREKQLKKIQYEDKILEKIRKFYTDDFFITDLNIKQKNITPFLNFCFKKNIIAHFNKDERLKLTKILMQESKTFPQDKTEISLIKKE
ncbi:carboxypeptidase-like regulatory domain-containing protein [Polaribacter sp.]|uniref:carboxypeptidase-like regulatory domain-containing protein n=1 Tax=Polaribacter sp. TaxID=1920175 RepID=UPI003F6D1EAF